MSHYTKHRAASYYNDLLTGTEADFKKLLKKYSICPPSDIGGYRGKDVGVIHTQGNAPANSPQMSGTTRGEDIRLGQVQKSKRVAYVELALKPRGNYTVTGNEGGDTIYFNASYNPAPNHVPVYFLPWDSNGASVRMTIPAVGGNNPDPDIFFTAAINGCSVFFQGTRRNPTIYHCGGSTGFGKTEIQEAEEFWEEVVAEFMDEDTQAGRNLGILSNRSVSKSQYVATSGVKSKPDVHAGGQVITSLTTRRAKNYQNILKAKSKLSHLTIEEVAPWACVLGRRDGNGDWTFYLQENATVIYHQINRKISKLFKGQKTQTHMVSRPLKYSEVFPNGAGHHCVRSGIPKIH